MRQPCEPSYCRKIKTVSEIRQILGPRPRTRTVIMCHGTFDLVHPGHIRHLSYAKSKADVLVASVTSDMHITKGSLRPFVPESLRAMNLAALEPVDYVIVDDYPTPIENLRLLEPDYFAKGYEYSANGVHPRTCAEMRVLESYGGEMIFTPGDVVYSSSAHIDSGPPQIACEKLQVLMQAAAVGFEDLRATVGTAAGKRIHVVGDTIVDIYTHCSLIGGAAKTPTFSVKYEHQEQYCGGGAVVAKHLSQAGAEVRFSTVLGDDVTKDYVLENLAAHGILCEAAVDAVRPTTQKNVFLANGYRMLKVDRVDNRPISDKALDHLQNSLASHKADAVIFSDFRHGIFGPRTVTRLSGCIPRDALRAADSQVANRWGNILDFKGFDLITPNEREARFALGDQDSTIRPLATELYRQSDCRILMLKLAERGLLTQQASSGAPRSFFTVDSFAARVVDPVGAGDALLAYAVLALVTGKSPAVASILGSVAAAVTCEREGNEPVRPTEVLQKLDLLERQITYAQP